jgi:hypothetical protein
MRRWMFAWGAVLIGLASGSATSTAAAETQVYRPMLRHETEYLSIEAPAAARARLEAISTFPLDRDGTNLDSNFFFLPQVRIGTRIENRKEWPVRLQFEYEHDVVTGTGSGAPRQEIGERLPNGEKIHDELRRLQLRATIPSAHLQVSGGYMLSHWGLGMVANDGAHGWTPGSAYFGDPRSGDRVIRFLASTLPLTDYNLIFRVAYDYDVVDDEILVGNDEAYQVIGSMLVGAGQPHWGGLYVVYRSQDSDQRRGFDAVLYDLTASTRWSLDKLGIFTLAGEFAVVTGSTNLAQTPELAKHDLFQIGAAVRAALDRGNHGFVFDFLFASGDENFDDDDQNSFRVDPNLEYGLMLFRQVMAAQTGRTTVTAADPNLVGRPVPDLDRIPTGGAPANTVTLFPRAWWRPMEEGLEVYGGPLFALSDVSYADPFNTRINGGNPHNPLGGKPGSFYGTELDLGLRYLGFVRDVELLVGLEAGVLITGNAFTQLDGRTMGDVWGGRFMLEARL